MSAILQLDDCISVRVEYTSDGNNKAYNILHYSLQDVDVDGGGLFPGESMFNVGPVIAQEMFDTLSPTWAAASSEGVSITAVTVQNLSRPPFSRQYTYLPPGAGLPGQIVSDPLPLQDAVTLIKQGELATRKHLGRIFVPGCPESGQASGVLTGAQADLYKAMAQAWSNIVSVAYIGYTLQFGPTLYNPREQPEPVQRFVAEVVLSDSILKTQRRRRPGKGI